MLEKPEVIAALIQGVCGIVATVIAAVTASLIGKRIKRTDDLKESLNQARADIAFLMAVEEKHCSIHKETQNGKSNRNKIRDQVKSQGLEWSGKHTPGRVK